MSADTNCPGRGQLPVAAGDLVAVQRNSQCLVCAMSGRLVSLRGGSRWPRAAATTIEDVEAVGARARELLARTARYQFPVKAASEITRGSAGLGAVNHDEPTP